MERLSDTDLTGMEMAESIGDFGRDSHVGELVDEVRQHRAMVKRLEEWAERLDANIAIMGGDAWIGDQEVGVMGGRTVLRGRKIDGHVARLFCAALRNRMRGA